MSVYGWDYPAGAEHDPRAPWNQHDDNVCPACGDDLDDDEELEDGKCSACAAQEDHYWEARAEMRREDAMDDRKPK